MASQAEHSLRSRSFPERHMDTEGTAMSGNEVQFLVRRYPLHLLIFGAEMIRELSRNGCWLRGTAREGLSLGSCSAGYAEP